uniref:CIA30 domain-containing protein n=1 Tax=Steinernema glaseri TaxID=37863 RepID=A0A1I7YI86_9BILA
MAMTSVPRESDIRTWKNIMDGTANSYSKDLQRDVGGWSRHEKVHENKIFSIGSTKTRNERPASTSLEHPWGALLFLDRGETRENRSPTRKFQGEVLGHINGNSAIRRSRLGPETTSDPSLEPVRFRFVFEIEPVKFLILTKTNPKFLITANTGPEKSSGWESLDGGNRKKVARISTREQYYFRMRIHMIAAIVEKCGFRSSSQDR